MGLGSLRVLGRYVSWGKGEWISLIFNISLKVKRNWVLGRYVSWGKGEWIG